MDGSVSYTVLPEDDGQEVLTLLRRKMGASAGLVRSLKLMPLGITLDGEQVTVRRRAFSGQVLRIACPSSSSENVLPVRGELSIVYEDEQLLILNKPAGLAVHPSPGNGGDTLAGRVVQHYIDMGQSAAFRAVNRLDKGTSGLMCVGKTRYCAQKLCSQLGQKGVRRIYRAVVVGQVRPSCGTIDLPIGHCEGRGIMRRVDESGVPAVTHYKTVEEGSKYSLLQIELETGRTHQIRVHFSHLGHPVAGDFMYGEELPWLKGQALHSCQLELTHPATGEKMGFSCPQPDYFSQLLKEV